MTNDASECARNSLLTRFLAVVATFLVALIASYGVAWLLRGWPTGLVGWLLQPFAAEPEESVIEPLSNIGVGGAGALLIALFWPRLNQVVSPVREYLQDEGKYLEVVTVLGDSKAKV